MASVGGPWTIRNVTPIADRVELKFGRTTRGGALDSAALATVTSDELAKMIDEVRSVRSDIPIGLFLLVAVGDDALVAPTPSMLGTNFCGQFVGSSTKVLDSLRSLEALGINRIQVTEFLPGSIAGLAEEIA